MKVPFPLEDKARASLGSFDHTLARLRAWGRPLLSLGESLAASDAGPCVVLGHDVRRNLKSALTMAQWESAAGLRGTFFLRPVGSLGEDSSFYGRIAGGRIEPSKQMLDDARAIIALGHEIGLMGPFGASAARLGMTVQSFVASQVALLRESGIPVSALADGEAALTPTKAGVVCALEQLQIAATWDESRLAEALLGPAPAGKLLLRFDTDVWSRVSTRSSRDSTSPPISIAKPEPPPPPPPPLLLVGPSGGRFSVALRGGAVGRRMLLAPGKGIVPDGVHFWSAEATSCRSLAERTEGRLPDAELASALVRLEAMPVLQRDAFLAQLSSDILKAKQLDLLVVDTEIEYDRTWWRHREHGWTVWFPSRFVRQVEVLEQLFELVPPPDARELAQSVLALLRHLRRSSPNLPALVLGVHGGSSRAPSDLARQLADAFAAAGDPGVLVMAAASSDAVDAAVDGAGLPLLQAAWSAGLHRHFPQAAAVPLPIAAPSAEKPPPAPPVPLVRVSFQRDTPTCSPSCARSIDSTATSVAEYFLWPEDPVDTPRRYTPSLLPMAEAWDFAAWEKAIKPLSGGNRLREKRKAIELGYTARLFEYAQYVPDMHEVNHSKDTRSGGAMRGSYQRSVEEMGGAPTKPHPLRLPACPHHWGLMFGVFRPAPGRKQGNVVVDDQLVGYISLRRVGEVVLYSQILGHGDYLHDFVLVLLHHEVIRWLSSEREGLAQGLEFVMYGGAESGGESLLQWKRRAGFRSMRVAASGAHFATTA